MRPNEVVRRLRQIMGFTQQQMADYLGVSKSTLIRYEKGLTTPKGRVSDKLIELATSAVEQVEDMRSSIPNIRTMTSLGEVSEVMEESDNSFWAIAALVGGGVLLANWLGKN